MVRPCDRIVQLGGQCEPSVQVQATKRTSFDRSQGGTAEQTSRTPKGRTPKHALVACGAAALRDGLVDPFDSG